MDDSQDQNLNSKEANESDIEESVVSESHHHHKQKKTGVVKQSKNSLAPEIITGRTSNTSGETEEITTTDDDNFNSETDARNLGYEELSVNQEIKELFQFIQRFNPFAIQLDFKLKPFNPEYIPAVGDADPFIKIPRPDNRLATLGLTVVDEPSAKQSDPTALDLQLRTITKTTDVRTFSIKTIPDAIQNPKQVTNWINNVENLHKNAPPISVLYTKCMPDLDTLMEEWPPEFQQLLSKLQIPSAGLNCTLENYIDIVCNILDIPVYESRIESLHVFFSLYSSFREVQMFHGHNDISEVDRLSIPGGEDYSILTTPPRHLDNENDINISNVFRNDSVSKTLLTSTESENKSTKKISSVENFLHEKDLPHKKRDKSHAIEQSHKTTVETEKNSLIDLALSYKDSNIKSDRKSSIKSAAKTKNAAIDKKPPSDSEADEKKSSHVNKSVDNAPSETTAINIPQNTEKKTSKKKKDKKRTSSAEPPHISSDTGKKKLDENIAPTGSARAESFLSSVSASAENLGLV